MSVCVPCVSVRIVRVDGVEVWAAVVGVCCRTAENIDQSIRP